MNRDSVVDVIPGKEKDHNSLIEKWAVHIANTSFSDIDIKYVQHAKNRIIDIIGCIIGGAGSAGCDMVRTLVKAGE